MLRAIGGQIAFHQILVFAFAMYPVLVYPVLRYLDRRRRRNRRGRRRHRRRRRRRHVVVTWSPSSLPLAAPWSCRDNFVVGLCSEADHSDL